VRACGSKDKEGAEEEQVRKPRRESVRNRSIYSASSASGRAALVRLVYDLFSHTRGNREKERERDCSQGTALGQGGRVAEMAGCGKRPNGEQKERSNIESQAASLSASVFQGKKKGVGEKRGELHGKGEGAQ